MQKKVYIILLNWNGKEDTLECLKSFEKIKYDNYQIIVVDNGSEDDSVVEIEKKYPKVKIIENKKNLGFAGGNNVGIKYAMDNNVDYVLLINNDTIVEKNFLTELVKIGDSDEKIGLLGSKIYFHGDKKRIWFAGGKINWLKNKGTHIGLDEIDEGQYDKTKEVDYLTGCCLLIKRKVIERISGLEEDYFLYYEDTDYSLRAQKIGYKCVYVPESRIYHKISRSTKPGSASYVHYHVRNGLLMARRNGNILTRLALYPYCLVLSLKQVAKIIVLPKKRSWTNAVLRGVGDFLIGRTGKI